MTAAIEIRELVKDYGRVHALRGINLRVETGEIFGFVGPNGAGKSTTIRVMLDLIRPTSGSATVFGQDCQRDSVLARRLIGYLPSSPVFPPRMSANDVFAHIAAVRGEHLDEAYRDELTRRLRLDSTRSVDTLSRGNRQKVGLIQALLPRPPLLILDEPTTGLDPLIQAEVEDILREAKARGTTVFFSSHILEEVEHICTRAAIVREGRIVDVFDLAEQRRLAPIHVEVTFGQAPRAGAFDGLGEGVRLLSLAGRRATFEVHGSIDGLVKRLAAHTVDHLVARETTLEELFIQHYRGDEPAEASS
ncbi:MAG: ABC transporter ATP-binding protein [Chloroflexi bacterium]|nr:ABC transporter ATP-binding protein [Chloroflexota bacterium]